MKKLFFLLMGVGITMGALAQTTQTKKDDQVKKTEMKNLRSDVRAHQTAKHKVNKDLSHVKVKKAMKDHKDVARLNKDERSHSKQLKKQGVGHSVAKAKRQVRVQDDNRKDHTQ